MNTINHKPFVFVFLIILILISSCEKEKKYDKLYALEYYGINENQKVSIFTDNFDDNTNDWVETESEWFTFRIENGYYLIHCKTIFGPSKTTEHYEEFQYFELECSIKIVDNPDDEFCGFTCSSYDRFFFKDGSVKYGSNVVVSSSAVNPIGQYNKLVIRRIDGTIIYFLNDQEIGISQYTTKTNSIGFLVGNNATVHVDYVKIFKLNI